MLSFLFRLIPAQEVHAHSGGHGKKTGGAGGGGAVGSKKKTNKGKKQLGYPEEIKKLKQRITRQETFIQRMSPSKYSRREVQIEKNQLKEWKAKLTDLRKKK